MPFDPNLPTENTLTDAAQMRGQLNALKALNDAQAAQIVVLQNQLAAQQAKWDTLATQLADITPLEIMVSDPPTQNDVQSIVYQANAMLAAVKAALT